MAKKIMVLIFSFLTLLSYSSARAQVNPVYKRMVQNGWSYPYKNGLKRLTGAKLDSEFLKSMGYSPTMVSKLKRAGITVVGFRKKRPTWDSKEWTALSDCIVIGTVSKIEHPSWARPFYNSVVYVRVDSFLRNDYGLAKEQVAVMQVSGPQGNGQVALDLSEPHWTVGEHVLLFLNASQLITYAANNNMHKLYTHLINSFKIRFQLVAMVKIESNEVVIDGKQKSLTQLTSEADSIMKIISHHAPTNR